MFKEIIRLITINPVLSVILSLLLTLFVWIYKENRKSIVEEKRVKIAQLQKKLEQYCALESSLALYLRNPDDVNLTKQLYDILGKSKPMLSKELKNIISDFYKDGDLMRATSMMSILKSEMSGIISSQEKHLVNLNPEDPIEFLQELFKPLQTLFVISVLSVIASITIQITMNTPLLGDKIIVMFFAVSCTISFNDGLFDLFFYHYRERQTT